MAKKNYQLMIKKLVKQITAWRRKEKAARKQLRLALKAKAPTKTKRRKKK